MVTDRSGCRSGSDLSLGEWSRRRKQFPLYFGHERHAPEAVTFDYESNASSYAIRLQVKDEHNATLEGNFTVLLLDVYEGPSSDFRGKNISSHDFSGQDLSTALFDHTTIFSSFLNGQRVGANLLGTNAKFTGLNLQQTDFRGVNLAGVDLSNCILTIPLTSNGTNNQVSKLTALFDGTTIFSGVHPVTLQRVAPTCLTGNGATLTGSYPGTDFRGVNLAGADFSESDLSQSIFDNTTVFSIVNPASGESVGANLNGSNAQPITFLSVLPIFAVSSWPASISPLRSSIGSFQ